MTNYKICTQCIMDTTDSTLFFNENGFCSHCEEFEINYKKNWEFPQNVIDEKLKTIGNFIKKRAGRSKYHCILGMSGGVDSSFCAYFIVEKMGLNPLIVHFDNGWNSTIAVENIKKIVTKLNLDMMTYVIDWDEFRDLQRAFFYASVLDIEMLTDNAIHGATAKIAKEKRINCVVSGGNFATESGLPKTWSWEKLDAKNIKSIHRRYGKVKLKSFPFYSPWKFIFDKIFNNIYLFDPLNFIQYSKTKAMQTLKENFDWSYYGGKHYESIFTKFYQAYILPTKFGIDKRRAHLSSLIRNKEISREEALIEISKPLYDNVELKQDIEYVTKKLGFSQDEFTKLMALPPVSHTTYPSDFKLLSRLKSVAKFLKVKRSPFS